MAGTRSTIGHPRKASGQVGGGGHFGICSSPWGRRCSLGPGRDEGQRPDSALAWNTTQVAGVRIPGAWPRSPKLGGSVGRERVSIPALGRGVC